MSAGVWFWLVYVVCIIGACVLGWPFPAESRRTFGIGVILFILVGLIGWRVFGPPIQ